MHHFTLIERIDFFFQKVDEHSEDNNITQEKDNNIFFQEKVPKVVPAQYSFFEDKFL